MAREVVPSYATRMSKGWKLLVHGGSVAQKPVHPDPRREALAREGLAHALKAGAEILKDGGSAVDAVEAAARALEDDPCFNAGRGSALTAEGIAELDAAIMDGRTRRAGAVAGLRTTRAPVSLARRLMEQGPHLFLTGSGADEFAREHGVEQVPNDFFIVPERRRQLAEFIESGAGFDDHVKYGTIGVVAVDSTGHVASATSTGGGTGKRWGRTGDSPLIGCGTYADDRSAAASATGLGEYFIRAVAAHEVAARVRLGGETLQQALDSVLADVVALGGEGGLIAVAPSGDWAWGFTTPAMYRGFVDQDGGRVAIYADEDER